MKKIISLGLLSACLATSCAMGMERSQYAHTTHLLVALPEANVTFINEPAGFKEKNFEEKRDILLSQFQGITFDGPDGDQKLTVDCSLIPSVQEKQPGSKTRKFLTHGLPIAGAFLVGYFVAKKLGASE